MSSRFYKGCSREKQTSILKMNRNVIVYSLNIIFSNIVQINMTGATSGAGTAHPSGAPEFTPGFQWGSCYSIQFYLYVLFIVVCPFVLFLLAIVLSVLLQYTVSDYPFGIFKLFFLQLVEGCQYLIPEVELFFELELQCYVNEGPHGVLRSEL